MVESSVVPLEKLVQVFMYGGIIPVYIHGAYDGVFWIYILYVFYSYRHRREHDFVGIDCV